MIRIVTLAAVAALIALPASAQSPTAKSIRISTAGKSVEEVKAEVFKAAKNLCANETVGASFPADEMRACMKYTVRTAFAQSSPIYGVDLLEIALYDSSSNLIASASGTPIAFLDSFSQTGIALGAGAYLFSVFGDVSAGKQAFVSISLAANNVVPIPAAGLLLLTGLGALGGIATWRRRRVAAGEG